MSYSFTACINDVEYDAEYTLYDGEVDDFYLVDESVKLTQEERDELFRQAEAANAEAKVAGADEDRYYRELDREMDREDCY